jgi:hypothetical protein
VKAHVVEFAGERLQARLYVAEAIPVSRLSKGHRQMRLPTDKPRGSAFRRIDPPNGEIRDRAESPTTERRRFGLDSRTIVDRPDSRICSSTP